MHAFRRGKAPDCLNVWIASKGAYGNLPKECKDAVRQDLMTSQEGYCAYCEERPGGLNPSTDHWHLEHHVPQSTGHGQLDWNNMIASCQSKKHCGHFKANRPDQIIDPSNSCPTDFLVLYSDGKLHARSMLCNACCKLANDTIDVLNLNEVALVRNRRKAIERESKHKGVNLQARRIAFHDLLATKLKPQKPPARCPGCS